MKILKKMLIMAIAASMLTACGSTTVIPAETRIPPAALTAQCPDLTDAPDGKLATILENSLERAQMYYDCQARHKALSQWAAESAGQELQK
ncbi:MAG: hypothetical protein DYH15_12200 [Nitrosomonas sp. PRO4]|nr:hypothetical protein [Nitrosomonas sp. PRO4]